MKTCGSCGSNEFNKSNNCISCQKERGRKYYEQNKQKVKDAAKAWKLNNVDKVKVGAKIYREREYEKMRQLQQAWVKNNKDKVNAKARRHYDKNAELLREKSRNYYKENIDKCRERRSDYRSRPEYKEINIRNVAARRSRIKGSQGKLSIGITKKLISLQNNKCACCKISLQGIKFHVDHIMPLALGGDNNDSNVQILCRPCNQSKHAKHPVDFMQQRGYLL